jgi:hypothetical protein
MLYISSYCIVYVFLLGVSVFNSWKSVKTIESKSIAEKASLIFSENKFVWCGLVILIAFSFFYVRQFMRQRNNTRIKKKVEENAVIENFGFLTANILTVILPTAFSDYGIWMAAIIFVFVGITFIFSNGMQTSPVFMVYGYKTYKCDDGYIITRLSREKINILMEDEQDGIEAREIVKGVYVTFPK